MKISRFLINYTPSSIVVIFVSSTIMILFNYDKYKLSTNANPTDTTVTRKSCEGPVEMNIPARLL